MATRTHARAARLGLELWIIYSVVLPTLILFVVYLLSLALPWVIDAYLQNIGTGEVVLLAGLISVGAAVEIEAYMRLTAYPGGRMTTWKHIILGTGIVEFVAFGGC